MKKFIYQLVIALSLVIAGTSVYSFIKNNDELKQTKSLHATLMKDYNSLKVKDDNKQKDIDKLNKQLEETKKELDKLKKESQLLNNDNIEQSDNNSVVSQTTKNETPITEYKVPTEEDINKINEEQSKKESEPQYATAIEEQFSVARFSMDNGISMETFNQLNPGVTQIKSGQSYRIK